MTTPSQWRRVNRANPCPVCQRFDWCAVATDGAVALCQRVESPRRIGEAGWLHRLKNIPWRSQGRCIRRIPLTESGSMDMERLADEFQQAVDPGRLHQLAVSLGLSVASLCQLGVGWSADHRAWSFPMTDAGGAVLGVRLRRPNGVKFAVKGGREGLFLPATAGEKLSPLYICEGPTDTAALLQIGFSNVAGRPSCTGGIKLLVELVRRRFVSEVVILADGDEPGRRGADNLASVLVAYVPAARVVAPPQGVKDARDWLRAGAGRPEVEAAIQAASVRRLSINAAAIIGSKR
ncbi:MAG TPA: hypothetical protein DDY78_30065 [Planctomycetales bacterium]|jgi:hypothetical protein|nr:hypothetical protein [Planctomycetales bacterium]